MLARFSADAVAWDKSDLRKLRRTNECRMCDLAGANLNHANLIKANLGGANLTEANLSGANLTKANLTKANLGGANLTKANLTDANLTNTNLRNVKLSHTNLTGAILKGAIGDRGRPIENHELGVVLSYNDIWEVLRGANYCKVPADCISKSGWLAHRCLLGPCGDGRILVNRYHDWTLMEDAVKVLVDVLGVRGEMCDVVAMCVEQPSAPRTIGCENHRCITLYGGLRFHEAVIVEKNRRKRLLDEAERKRKEEEKKRKSD